MAPSKSGQFRVVAEAPGTVAVSGTLNFATAANALAAMRAAFGEDGRSTLDLGGVTTCDSAGLACVLAALSEADQGGRRVLVQHVPVGMQALAQVCGVEPFLH
ncbi:STAS domain-containing protein [Dyella acidiphila]|uniref:STAS domain-containing protein n=1 Tax=Dyella acidiphila TaxID=2775866 RepID=A0ABR9G4M1_9GAMM|nr:STAS domain-containing protein [Dyella acidiphila]MBE1158952.1 STAS domain-containing protein [Dyella acidiphila]